MESGEFIGRLLAPLRKTGLTYMKNALKPLGKTISVPLAVKAAASAADVGIYQKHFGSATITLITWNKEIEKISWKELTLLENLVYWVKVPKNLLWSKKGGFLSMLLGALGC